MTINDLQLILALSPVIDISLSEIQRVQSRETIFVLAVKPVCRQLNHILVIYVATVWTVWLLIRWRSVRLMCFSPLFPLLRESTINNLQEQFFTKKYTELGKSCSAINQQCFICWLVVIVKFKIGQHFEQTKHKSLAGFNHIFGT